MLIISKRVHIEQFLTSFSEFASFDSQGHKYYFVFHDRERGGQLTLMNTNGNWSIHGKGDKYSDIAETFLAVEEVLPLLWKHRAAVNHAIKEIRTKDQQQSG
ncbi:hypothetical protein [Alkalihalobacterium bogoriense]|uniref:hypothetical protein n=1 Tax=Alkalihalobacterium bogoriense TaxID=246272 RepID=UPI000550C021|nr:hypothetical protein [Alkalihalobacterium bogoriense]